MEKNKILVFSTSYYPFVGGAELAIQEAARRLTDTYEFIVVTARFRKDLALRERVPEGVIVRFGFGSPLDKWFFPFLGVIYGWIFLRRHTGTVLWGMDISLGALTAAFLKFFFPGELFVFTIQYGYGDERIRRGRLGTINLALRFMLHEADRVTAISRYLIDLARRYGYTGEADLIHNGVDIEKFANRKSQIANRSKKIIITTSRLVPKNGIDILIRAVAEVRKKIPEIECWILGDGPEKANYQLLVTNLKLEENVKFFGNIPYEELPTYLHASDVFVRPSRSEGMGSSFVEALAAGIPIIGTPVGGITDIIKDGTTGLFSRVDDPHDCADKIVALLSDTKLAQKIVDQGQRMVRERFQWAKIAEQYRQSFHNAGRTMPMTILIATPLLPPHLGGPALYGHFLGEEFRREGHRVFTAAFSDYLRYPPLIRHLLYARKIFFLALKSDIIFLLDPWSAGVPAAFVSALVGKKIVLRLEGDFLWERFVERTRRPVTLTQFYQTVLPLNAKEKLMKFLFAFVLRRSSRVVFSSAWRKNIALRAFPFLAKKSLLIKNVVETKPWGQTIQERELVIVWAGRMLYLKNLYGLIDAFQTVNDGIFELHCIGDGPERSGIEKFIKERDVKKVKILPPLRHQELLYKISRSAFLVLPSLSDVGPNVIADAITTVTPFLMTEESGYAELFCDMGVCVNPLDKNSIQRGIMALMDEGKRKEYTEKIKSAALIRTWKDAAGEWMVLFRLQM